MWPVAILRRTLDHRRGLLHAEPHQLQLPPPFHRPYGHLSVAVYSPVLLHQRPCAMWELGSVDFHLLISAFSRTTTHLISIRSSSMIADKRFGCTSSSGDCVRYVLSSLPATRATRQVDRPGQGDEGPVLQPLHGCYGTREDFVLLIAQPP